MISNNAKIPYLRVIFDNMISIDEIPLFRGAIINKVSQELSLFHNHNGEGFYYRYPLIQYKRIGGKAAIFCVGQGTESIANFFSQPDFSVRMGERDDVLSVESIIANQWLLQVWDGEFRYSIRKWLPFNKKNYDLYQMEDSLIKRTQQLEKILKGNILSMSSGLNHYIEKQIEAKIVNYDDSHVYSFKGIGMQGIDAVFTTNVYMPDYIGVGKGVSLGFGMIKTITANNQ